MESDIAVEREREGEPASELINAGGVEPDRNATMDDARVLTGWEGVTQRLRECKLPPMRTFTSTGNCI